MESEISNGKKFEELTNMWKLNNTMWNNWWVKEETIREIKMRWMKIKIQSTKTYGMQLKLRKGKFLAINACIKKEEGSQISNLTYCLNTLGKED